MTEPSGRASPTKTRRSPDLFGTLADPTRRSILDLLWRGPKSAGEIGARFPHLTQPGVSRHLRVLRDSGVVRVTARAQRRVYAVVPERLAGVEEWVRKYLEDEESRLRRLGRFVEAPRNLEKE